MTTFQNALQMNISAWTSNHNNKIKKIKTKNNQKKKIEKVHVKTNCENQKSLIKLMISKMKHIY